MKMRALSASNAACAVVCSRPVTQAGSKSEKEKGSIRVISTWAKRVCRTTWWVITHPHHIRSMGRRRSVGRPAFTRVHTQESAASGKTVRNEPGAETVTSAPSAAGENSTGI
jgi:hypothetical protein